MTDRISRLLDELVDRGDQSQSFHKNNRALHI